MAANRFSAYARRKMRCSASDEGLGAHGGEAVSTGTSKGDVPKGGIIDPSFPEYGAVDL